MALRNSHNGNENDATDAKNEQMQCKDRLEAVCVYTPLPSLLFGRSVACVICVCCVRCVTRTYLA